MKLFVVGVDASERAALVLEQAVALAQRLDAKLCVLRVVGIPPEVPLEAYAVPPPSLVDVLMTEAHRGLEKLVASCPKDIIHETKVKVGVPWQELCAVSGQIDASMLIIGSHGYGMLDRLLGTTAARVVNHAPCTVMVIRPYQGS
jgi:nucleotide-binding universal stress UspA family protein